jgi:hypothetical protein
MGGHSPFGSTYGMGADVALEYKVVIPSGELVVANAQTNPDLFWALRGGGGSTYGIVTEATVKAFPSPVVYGSIMTINATNWQKPDDDYWEMVAQLHRELDQLAQKGVSGYYYVYPATTLIMLLAPDAAGKKLSGYGSALGKKLGAMKGVKKRGPISQKQGVYKTFFAGEFNPIDGSKLPASEVLLEKLGAKIFERGDLPDAFWEANESKLHKRMDMEAAEPNGHSQLDSRLLGARHMSNPQLATLLKQAMPPTKYGQLRGNFVGGGAVASSKEDVSMNPAWRTALTHVIATGYPGNWSVDSLRTLAPDSGAYGNEVSLIDLFKHIIQLTLSRPLHGNPTGRLPSGERITQSF